jgi:hypothetical protein
MSDAQPGAMPPPVVGPSRMPILSGAWPKGGPNATQYQRYPRKWVPPSPVFDAYRFSRWISLNQVLGTQDVLVIAAPDLYRTVLLMSCPTGSLGSLLIAFDQNAGPTTAIFTITPGGVILLDFNVPQNDVHAAGTLAGTIGVFAYANVPFIPGS